MWALGVVVAPPALDDDLRFSEAVEDLPVEQLVSEFGVEALAVAVLPRTARLDVSGSRPHGGDPLPHRLGDELRAVVGPYVIRHAAQDEEIGQHVDDVRRSEPPVDPDCQALPGELVDEIEHAELPSIMGPALDEVVGPDVVRTLGPQTDAGPVVQPEPPLLRLLLWDLQPLPPPYPLDPLHIHRPARLAQQRRDPPVAIAAELRGERDDVRRQGFFIGPTLRRLSLGRTMLPEHKTGEPFRDPELLPDMLDASTAAGGAQKFPDAASRKISFSSVRSETAFRSRSFSFSSSFSRFTWSAFNPPNSLRHR